MAQRTRERAKVQHEGSQSNLAGYSPGRNAGASRNDGWVIWWFEYNAEGSSFQAEIRPHAQVERLDLKTLARRKRVGVNALHQ